jgi:membrane protease YdiL (CAAX protease family)
VTTSDETGPTGAAPITSAGDTGSPTPGKPLDLTLSLAALVLLGACSLKAFQAERAGTWSFYYWLVIPVLVLAPVLALWRLERARLVQLLRPARGDVTLGALLGFVLVLTVWLARTRLLALLGPGQTWLLFVYVQLGDARKFEALLPILLLAAGAAGHELLFHGYFQDSLSARFGRRMGYLSVVVLTALVYAPSAQLLTPVGAPPNPLFIAIAALVALMNGALVRLTNRLWPGFFARAIFLYFSIAQFRLPGL